MDCSDQRQQPRSRTRGSADACGGDSPLSCGAGNRGSHRGTPLAGARSTAAGAGRSCSGAHAGHSCLAHSSADHRSGRPASAAVRLRRGAVPARPAHGVAAGRCSGVRPGAGLLRRRGRGDRCAHAVAGRHGFRAGHGAGQYRPGRGHRARPQARASRPGAGTGTGGEPVQRRHLAGALQGRRHRRGGLRRGQLGRGRR